jgi:hypothetical protein
MNKHTLLARTIQTVVVLFGAFGGFLTAIAPPEVSTIATGTASLGALVLFLFATTLIRKGAKRRLLKIWAGVAGACTVIAIIAAVVYQSNLEALTFGWPPATLEQRHVRGSELTPHAMRYSEEHSEKSVSEVLADFGGLGNRELVWPESSISAAKRRLTTNYLLVVLGFSVAIASLLEIILLRKGAATD